MDAPATQAPADDVNDILIGTEFTFTRPSLHRLRLGEEATEEQVALKAEADELIYHWSEAVRKKPPAGLSVEMSRVAGKAGAQGARRFDYRSTDGAAIWYWILDLDDGCVETQTQPSSLNTLRGADVEAIISTSIFGVAATLDLVPHAEIGGGHLSLDVASAVGGNPEDLVKLLQAIETHLWAWNGEFNDPDALNAPWMSDLTLPDGSGESAASGYSELLDDLLEKIESDGLDLKDTVARLDEFSERLVNPEVVKLAAGGPEERAAAGHIRGEPLHYRAVNLEHAATGDDSARIEFRRVEAQQDYATLLTQVQLLLKYVTASRNWGTWPY